MTKNRLYLIATALILIALALLVAGLGTDSTLLWGAGLVVIAIAMLLSLTSRWAQ